MVFKYFDKGILRKLKIHVWYKFFFLDKLVSTLFGAADDSFLKTTIKEEMEQIKEGRFYVEMDFSFPP